MKFFFRALAVMLLYAGNVHAQEVPRYLAFQIFTDTLISPELRDNFPPLMGYLEKTAYDLQERIGVTASGNRHIGIILGPLAFEHSDTEVRQRIISGFDIAMRTGLAIGFHVDDSIFWKRMKQLNTPDTIEWLDWKKTPGTGRRLDWSRTPTKVMPQLCVNSNGVKAAVRHRAAIIGDEIAKGVKRLHEAGKDDLFIGVIAGWETQMGRDFDTGKSMGYCALTNAGYSEQKPPADMDAARVKITQDFIALWAGALVSAGVPKGKVYTHIAFMSDAMYTIDGRVNPAALRGSYLQTSNFTPPVTAFCNDCIPGFSTYPQPGLAEQWQKELSKHGNPAWASSEGSALDPAQEEKGGKTSGMETYLGNMFNHGAVLVNLLGWRLGDETNAFRVTLENENAIAAYRKFIRGETLAEAPIPIPVIPPADLPDKLHKAQDLLPKWVDQHGPSAVKDDAEKLSKALEEKRFDDANTIADTLLKTMGAQR